MTINITFSKTFKGSAISDSLDGGGTGLDFTQIINGQYAPITNKSLNTGRQDLYISHNHTSALVDCKLYLAEYGEESSNTYGGSDTKSNDFSQIVSLGNASGNSKNNFDGLSGGLWIDFRANCTDSQQFDRANYPTKVLVFGTSNTLGIGIDEALPILTDSLIYDNSGETLASSPIEGSIGETGNTTLGDSAHVRLRMYLPNSFAESGVFQGELIFLYSQGA
jgi:hypothetical protein